jgi:flavodoxin/NAD-dependent dihydropyrimidine dehydrogenase PreA subunit
MKISIACFSQTGNTRKVAKAMGEVFKNVGHEVRNIGFNKLTHDNFTSADLIGVGAPSFESQAPTPVREFLKNLPPLEGKKAFVFSTSGGAPGRVLYDLAKPLMMKGAEVIGGFLCRGTCYYPLPCMINRFPQRPDSRDLSRARSFAKSVLAHLSSSASGPIPDSRPDTFKHGFGFYNIIGAILKDPLVRLVMPKPKADGKKCTECKWCVHECPTHSMTLNPKPRIAKTCIRCYRCMTGCPEEALSARLGISNFITWTIYNTTFERWMGDIQKGERIY